MIIEFRNSDGSAFERHSLGGARIEYAATVEGYAQRMVDLGAPVEFAARAAARYMRALTKPRPAATSVAEFCDLDKVRDMVNRQKAAEWAAVIAADKAAEKI